MDECVFRVLSVLPQLSETVAHNELPVDFSKLDGGHVDLHQVSIVVDVVSPGLEKDVEATDSLSLLSPYDDAHLREHLR